MQPSFSDIISKLNIKLVYYVTFFVYKQQKEHELYNMR